VIRVANAPCSWGVLEFGAPPAQTDASHVLDEMAAAGYAGTELGDWGFLPTRPDALVAELGRRGLVLVGGFVPVALARAAAIDEGLERSVRTARLIAAAGIAAGHPGNDAMLVLSDDNASVPRRTARAGRIEERDGLSPAEWDGFAARAEQIARAVRDETGLRTAFHHHCAGFVETPREIDALMSRTSSTCLGLCLDTGHLTYAGGDALAAIAMYRDRVWHVHFKDCDPRLASAAREREWDYHTAVRNGIFCELGCGAVPFAAVRDALRAQGYSGWVVVEQDVLPGLGTPAASARRNRDYLRQLGL
jgi:inosose dehydratase